MAGIALEPADFHNQALLAQAHPADWVNPRPHPGGYDLVVVGGGTAGLVTAAGAAGLGARVALVERHLMGGDCLNYGCVPSKALLRSARAAKEVLRAAEFGVRVEGSVHVDFGAAMERMRRLRASISPHDSAARFRELGVDVFLGEGVFTGPGSLRVDGRVELRFRKGVVATGTHARIPPIAGLAESGCLTHETFFSLTERPPRVAVIGGGPIGCELAQCLARLGSRVWLFHNKAAVLDREDPAASRLIARSMAADGVTVVASARVDQVSRAGQGMRRIRFQSPEQGTSDVEVEAVLVAVGREPNILGLGLEAAGVAANGREGVLVDDRLRTTNPRVYACGDVCSRHRFTHAADAMARIVIQNALFLGRRRVSDLVIPRCTYTDPELAQVGMTPGEALRSGVAVDTYTRPLSGVDRARLDGDEEGFVQVLVARGTDRIVGATVVAPHAGESISELTVALQSGVGLGRLAGVIHPYPTVAEAIRQCGDAYQRTRLTPGVRTWLGRWLAWRR
jgi:pyruvate/2-oxoglutarate dehydrogenase complex dihydrolipoamide dehydrogenase (E3) component